MFTNDSHSVCLCRPMQLGKTTLLSLAEELFSVNSFSQIDSELQYSPGENDRNKWFVVRIDFGFIASSWEATWEEVGTAIDQKVGGCIKLAIRQMLSQNKELQEEFSGCLEDLDGDSVDFRIMALTTAVRHVGGRLLFLVDEYDLPIRNAVLQFLPQRSQIQYTEIRDTMRRVFSNYFSFFRSCKATLDVHPHAKLFLTGVTPIGIREMSGLNVKVLTFDPAMADAVGLTEADVGRMINNVHDAVPFKDDEERDLAFERIKRHFNNLCFVGGSSLFHTALVNECMNMLLKDSDGREELLRFNSVRAGCEPVPSSVYKVLETARNLRTVVKMLADGHQITGYRLNTQLSLEAILAADIDVGDYLTLLFHVGVVSARGTLRNPVFHMTSDCYRKDILEPLLTTLRSSLQQLTSLNAKEELYSSGEDILMDFVTSISDTCMASLMSWAASDEKNNILELQFQSHVLSEAFTTLNTNAEVTQEDRLPATGKRTDVTFGSDTCVVILELKQTKNAPTSSFLANAHAQLLGYIQTRRDMEQRGRNRAVAGFVIAMYNNGANYVVEKSREDSS